MTDQQVDRAEIERRRDVLRFWRDVEMFDVNTVDNTRAEKDAKGKPVVVRHNLKSGDKLPWDPKSKDFIADTDDEMWFHMVFGGTAERKAYVENILSVMVADTELSEREKEDFYGKCWTFAMMVTSDGRPFRESYIVANYAMATKLAHMGRSTADLEGAVKAMVDRFMDKHPDSGRSIHPQNANMPQGEGAKIQAEDPDDADNDAPAESLKWTIGEHVLNWGHFAPEIALRNTVLTKDQIGDAPELTIISKRMPRPKPHKITGRLYPQKMPEWNLMNSFYLEGLDRVLHNLETMKETALDSYLSPPVPEENRIDLLADPVAMAKAASPMRMPLGRWPSNPKHPLSFGQQVAVAEIADTLSEDHGMVAVNGPPGTGKTTLLRDIISHVVASRAAEIAKLRSAEDFFTNQVSENKDGKIWLPNPECTKGFGIVVASANNAAVDNISREIPLEGSIDRDSFAGASYLPGLAQTVADPRGLYDIRNFKQMERAAPPAWGLAGAALGRRSNIRNFFNKALAFTKADEQAGSPVVSLGDELFGIQKRMKKSGRGWHVIREEFLRLSQAISRSRSNLVAEETSLWASHDGEEEIKRLSKEIEAIRTRLDAPRKSDGPEVRETLRSRYKRCIDERERLVWATVNIDDNVRKHVTVPDENFFALGPEEQQRQSLWANHKMDEMRSKLFLLALELHEATLALNAKKVLNNIKLLQADLNGSSEGGMQRAGKRALWDTLFTVVPVVSTTLASLPRNFALTGEGHIGWMLIDEAGQASPQIVAEALWRSKRAVIIGDPRQIEPVVTTPIKLIEAFRQKHGVDLAYSPACSSAQVVADQTMSRGSRIQVGDEPPVWTGIPLRAHRRCVEPMFSIANMIAYDGQMVQSTPPSRMTASTLGHSSWLNVKAERSLVGKVNLEELDVLSSCFDILSEDWPEIDGRPADVYIITPFRDVAAKLKQMMPEVEAPGRVEAGTIHTFQGKEADIVFMVLGSNPGKQGAGSRAWAAKTPNMLNVAMTRARSRIHIIGNADDWSENKNFDQLYATFDQAGQIIDIEDTSISGVKAALGQKVDEPSLI